MYHGTFANPFTRDVRDRVEQLKQRFKICVPALILPYKQNDLDLSGNSNGTVLEHSQRLKHFINILFDQLDEPLRDFVDNGVVDANNIPLKKALYNFGELFFCDHVFSSKPNRIFDWFKGVELDFSISIEEPEELWGPFFAGRHASELFGEEIEEYKKKMEGLRNIVFLCVFEYPKFFFLLDRMCPENQKNDAMSLVERSYCWLEETLNNASENPSVFSGFIDEIQSLSGPKTRSYYGAHFHEDRYFALQATILSQPEPNLTLPLSDRTRALLQELVGELVTSRVSAEAPSLPVVAVDQKDAPSSNGRITVVHSAPVAQNVRQEKILIESEGTFSDVFRKKMFELPFGSILRRLFSSEMADKAEYTLMRRVLDIASLLILGVLFALATPFVAFVAALDVRTSGTSAPHTPTAALLLPEQQALGSSAALRQPCVLQSGTLAAGVITSDAASKSIDSLHTKKQRP